MSFRFTHSLTLPKDELICSQEGGSNSRDLLSINRTKRQVVWYGAGGCKVNRRFTLPSMPVDAKFCQFKSSHSEGGESSLEQSSLLARRAIAILLANGDLQVCMYSGEVYELTLPYPIKRMVSICNGLLLQRNMGDENVRQCLWMSNPLLPLTIMETNDRSMDNETLCVREDWLCTYSRLANCVSVLRLQAINGGTMARSGDDSLHRTDLCHSNFLHDTSPSPAHNWPRNGTPNVLLDLSRADQVNQKYRSPTVYSRESSLEFDLSRDPVRSESKASAAPASQYSAGDAALRSLLTPTNAQSRHAGIQRSTSITGGNLMSSVRSQPLLYSRGTSGGSGGSGNSNSAYHIRKKRAAQGPSPAPSPRPSPSAFLFEPSRRDSSGMAMDVDAPAFRAIDSPQNISNNSYNHLQDLSANGGLRGTSGASFSDTSNAELAGPPEMFLTCLARAKLPTGVCFPSSNLPSASFSGSFDSVGGLCVNVFDSVNGVFVCYRLYEESDEMDTDGDANNQSFCPAAQNGELTHSLELKYTNAPSSRTVDCEAPAVALLTKFLGVAHVSASLEGEGQATLQALGISAAAFPLALRSTQQLPLTLLLTENNRIQVHIGAQTVQEVPVTWQDDLADLEDSTVPAMGQVAQSLATVHSDNSLLLIHCEGKTRVLSLLPLFASGNGKPSLRAPSNKLLVEVISASVSTMRVMNTEGLTECVLGFLVNVHAEIGSLWVLSWLMAASFGIQYDLFVLALPSSNITPPSSPQAAAYLQHIYNVFAADAVRLYETSADHCIGAEIFNAAHAVLQDHLLRGDGVTTHQADTSALKDILRSTVLLVSQYQASFSSDLPMRSAYTSLMSTYGEYYQGRTQAAGRSNLDAVAWCKQCIEILNISARGRAESSTILLREFPLLPLLHSADTLLPCPTIRLAHRFLLSLTTNLAPTSTSGTAVAPARAILDAYVYAVHGGIAMHGTSPHIPQNTDWTIATAYFPRTIRRILDLAVDQCQADPNPAWPQYLLKLIDRRDLCGVEGNKTELLTQKKRAETSNVPAINTKAAAATAKDNKTDGMQAPESDGLLEVEKASLLRFTEDDRVHEICRMLRSSQPSYLKYEKAPEVSELDHRHKLQMKLLGLVRRVLANPVGRGMLTIASLEPLMAEALPIPPICLSGRVPPANSILQFDASTAHGDLTLWPDFHNGVAAALRVGPASDSSERDASGGGGTGLVKRSKITRNWIMYNRTASMGKAGGDAAHAGFLLGLGLWGHLTNLTVSDTYDYLVQGHEPTTVAVLIGTAASKIGTADPLLSKTISLHLPALLPPQHGEIEISPSVQAAALVSLGLLHCSSGHRLMTEFLLAELSRSPLSDRCECRESMVTAAGWALGMVLLGKGRKVCDSSQQGSADSRTDPTTPAQLRKRDLTNNAHADDALKGLADLRVESRLFQFIDGGKRPGESTLFPIYTTTDISSRSSRILEGADINTNVTAPGAIIALALIYIRSNDCEILQRLSLPTTVIALDAVRPDMLVYRAMAACLIQWDCIIPSADWVCAQIPAAVTSVLFPAVKSSDVPKDPKLLYQNVSKKLDGRTALALYLNAYNGYCYGIGIVFAGTANEQAKQTILTHLKLLQSFRDNKPLLKLPFPLDKSLRQSVEMCICLVSLSVSCVMAGSGDLECLRTLRELRWKVEDVAHGTHMALSMAIGMLFLGGGNYSLRSDPLSAACLLLSLCPRFPHRTIDHQYHLQALRHLYVLAAEPRALHSIDVDTGLTVSVQVQVELVDGTVFSMIAPGLLPELASIRRISVIKQPPDDQDSDKGDEAAGNVSPPQVRYFPTSIDMQLDSELHQHTGRDGSPQTVDELLRSTKSRVLRNSHKHTTVPPLFVKRVPSQLYRTEDGVHGGEDPAKSSESMMDGLKLAALPRSFGTLKSTSHADHDHTSDETVVRTRELLAGLRSDKGSADAVIGNALVKNKLFAAVVLGAVSTNC